MHPSFSPSSQRSASDKLPLSVHSAQSPRSTSSWGTQPSGTSPQAQSSLQPGRSPISATTQASLPLISGGGPPYRIATRSAHPESSLHPPAVHPLLEHDNAGRLYFDIAQLPRCIIFRRPADIRELAFYPPITIARFRVSGQRTWTFSIQNQLGITLKDVIYAIHEQMQQPLLPSEFLKLEDIKRKAASQGHQKRTANDPVEFAQGVRRLDCLYPNVLFVGLSLDTDNAAWNLHFASAY